MRHPGLVLCAVVVAAASLPLAAPAATADISTRPSTQQQPTSSATGERVERQGLIEFEYADVCADAEGAPVDLRRSFVGYDDISDAYLFAAEGCQEWDAADLGADGFVAWEVRAGGGAGEPDHVVRIEADEAGGLVVTVDDGAWTGRVQGGGGGYERFATVPADEVGDVRRFRVLSSDGGSSDELPETGAGEPLLSHPPRCGGAVEQPLVVTTHPGRYEQTAAAARAQGLRIERALPGSGVFTVRAAARVQRLEALPGVADVSPPVAYQRLAPTPTVPFYSQQWALPAINAPQAWERRTGSGLRVAVIDDGVDARREGLAGRVAAGHDTRFDRPLPAGSNSDRGGHGTAVAGTIAANGMADSGTAGVDWSAEVVPYRVFDAAFCATDVELAAAFEHAVDDGVDVVNISVGGPRSSALEASVRRAHQAGITVIAAAGNDREFGNYPMYPAGYPEAFGVGATLRSGEIAPYSNTGEHVHLVAPGGRDRGDPAEDLLVLGERGGVDAVAGSSFSAPLVAGAALLYLAEHPGSSPATVARALADSAVDLGPAGYDESYGHGLLDAGALLQPGCPPGQVPAAGFADVEGNFHRSNIDCVVWYDIARGQSSTAYGPAAGVRRDQMAAFLARTIRESGAPLPSESDQGFRDIAGNTHARAINQLAAAGVVNGTSGTTYSPRRVVRRDQMASFLVRAYEYIAQAALPAGRDAFRDDAGNPHEANINKAVAADFASGRADGTFGPRAGVRRDQMASFLANVVVRLADDGRVSTPAS